MLQRLILSRIASAEKQLGVPLDYCRFIVRVSLRAAFKFAKLIAVDEYRRVLPPGPCYVARIVAVRDADCGTCSDCRQPGQESWGIGRDIACRAGWQTR